MEYFDSKRRLANYLKYNELWGARQVFDEMALVSFWCCLGGEANAIARIEERKNSNVVGRNRLQPVSWPTVQACNLILTQSFEFISHMHE